MHKILASRIFQPQKNWVWGVSGLLSSWLGASSKICRTDYKLCNEITLPVSNDHNIFITHTKPIPSGANNLWKRLYASFWMPLATAKTKQTWTWSNGLICSRWRQIQAVGRQWTWINQTVKRKSDYWKRRQSDWMSSLRAALQRISALGSLTIKSFCRIMMICTIRLGFRHYRYLVLSFIEHFLTILSVPYSNFVAAYELLLYYISLIMHLTTEVTHVICYCSIHTRRKRVKEWSSWHCTSPRDLSLRFKSLLAFRTGIHRLSCVCLI